MITPLLMLPYVSLYLVGICPGWEYAMMVDTVVLDLLVLTCKLSRLLLPNTIFETWQQPPGHAGMFLLGRLPCLLGLGVCSHVRLTDSAVEHRSLFVVFVCSLQKVTFEASDELIFRTNTYCRPLWKSKVSALARIHCKNQQMKVVN